MQIFLVTMFFVICSDQFTYLGKSRFLFFRFRDKKIVLIKPNVWEVNTINVLRKFDANGRSFSSLLEVSDASLFAAKEN